MVTADWGVVGISQVARAKKLRIDRINALKGSALVAIWKSLIDIEGVGEAFLITRISGSIGCPFGFSGGSHPETCNLVCLACDAFLVSGTRASQLATFNLCFRP